MRFLSCENRVKPGSRPEGVTAHAMPERHFITDELIEFDYQDFLHSEYDCLEAWKSALLEDSGDGLVLFATLKEIAYFRFLSELAQQVGLTKDELYSVLKGYGGRNADVLKKLVSTLGLRFHYADMPNPELEVDDALASDKASRSL